MNEPVPVPLVEAVPRRRPRYDPAVVDRTLRFLRTLLRLRIADFVFWIVSFPVWVLCEVFLIRLQRIEVRGGEHLKGGDGGVFVLSNHISFAEGPVLGAMVWPRPIWFPAKADFYSSWLRGIFFILITAVHAIPVRRGEKDLEAISLIEEVLQRGDHVLLFPEGTRSRDGELRPGKPGVGMLVHSARPKVVPVYVEGMQRIAPPGRGFWAWRPGRRALVSVGAPMDLSHHWDAPFTRETGQAIADEVMEAIQGLKDEAAGWDEAAS